VTHERRLFGRMRMRVQAVSHSNESAPEGNLGSRWRSNTVIEAYRALSVEYSI
jgi:hypothetical protein